MGGSILAAFQSVFAYVCVACNFCACVRVVLECVCVHVCKGDGMPCGGAAAQSDVLSSVF